MKIRIAILFGILWHVSSFEIKDLAQDGVEFGDKTPTSQIIYVDENNDSEAIIKLVEITGVNGSLSLTRGSANVALLQPILGQISSDEYTLIVSRMDYELIVATNLENNFYINIVENSDHSSAQTVLVVIRNLDDESPTLTISTICLIPEEASIEVNNSECVFRVSDPDGWLASIDFQIVGDQGESQVFALKYANPPTDYVYESDVYLVLQDGQTLDYETKILYSFKVEAKDRAGHSTNPASIPIVVEVKDIPDQPPQWTSFQNVLLITEETPSQMQVTARDGDFGINNAIGYEILKNSNDFVHIDSKSGLITIDPIDRDQGIDNLTFNVIAFEVVDKQSWIWNPITLIISDLDDNIPEISVASSDNKNLNVDIDEGATDINAKIFVNDLDLGVNAEYTIELTSSNVAFLSAFKVVPKTGYKNTTCELLIVDPTTLDYENPEWRSITLELHTVGIRNPVNTDVLTIRINLIDVND